MWPAGSVNFIWTFGFWSFEFVSNLGFGASDLPAALPLGVLCGSF